MAHPLYHSCQRAVNRPVTLHLRSGQNYYGVLHQVSNTGVYLRPTGSATASPVERLHADTADNQARETAEAENVFFPFFFPFAALAGFTLGLAAGAIATRPFYGYGYGGYGGYGRYYW